MSWPKGIYVATVNNGVYYCSDFVDPSTQPTWATVNTGLANVGCREFKLDPFNPENKQYVLTESDRILYRRDNQGSWASILTPAEANTLLSDSGLSIHSFCVDISIAGRLWALVGATGDTLWAIYSDDYGETWNTTATSVYTSIRLSSIGFIRAYGDNVWVGTSGTISSMTWVKYSYDKGATWSYKELNSGYYGPIFHNSASPTRIYCTDNTKVVMHIDAGTLTSTNGFVDENDSGMWFDPDDADHQRSIYGTKLLETDDNWATYDEVTPSIQLTHISAIYSGTLGQMLVGLGLDTYQNQTVGVMAGFAAGIAGISGSMPHTSPYTDSIPDTCGGACVDGVQGVRALGNTYAHGAAMPGYAGSDRGTPLPGDRSAWDAENYPALHANDIDGAATDIHHTLGDGEFQAASGKTVDDHINDTDNPHGVTATDVGLGNVANILDKLDGTTAPTADDDSADGYSEGSRWVDVTNDKIYFCLDATEGAAVWQEVGAGGGGSGDMLKSTYDTDDNGIVDEAEAIDGVDSAGNNKYYGTDGSGTPGFHSLPAGGTVDADDVTYTPAVPADWNGGADPGDVDDALDQVAERVKDLEDAGGGGSSYYDPDNPPASPGTYDDEFNNESIDGAWSYSAADASFDLDQTSGTPHISESLMPGFLVMQADAIEKAFTPAIDQAFTLVIKFNIGINFSVNESWGHLRISGQNSNCFIEIRAGRYDSYYNGYRLVGANNGGAAEWANAAGGANTGSYYLAISHDGSKSINAWGSHDGKAWTCIERARSISNFTSFTTMDIEINAGKAGDSVDGIAVIDFVRYFETADQFVIGS